MPRKRQRQAGQDPLNAYTREVVAHATIAVQAIDPRIQIREGDGELFEGPTVRLCYPKELRDVVSIPEQEEHLRRTSDYLSDRGHEVKFAPKSPDVSFTFVEVCLDREFDKNMRLNYAKAVYDQGIDDAPVTDEDRRRAAETFGRVLYSSAEAAEEDMVAGVDSMAEDEISYGVGLGSSVEEVGEEAKRLATLLVAIAGSTCVDELDITVQHTKDESLVLVLSAQRAAGTSDAGWRQLLTTGAELGYDVEEIDQTLDDEPNAPDVVQFILAGDASAERLPGTIIGHFERE